MYLPTNLKNTKAKIDVTEKRNRKISNQSELETLTLLSQ